MAGILLMLILMTKNEFGKTSMVNGERAEDEVGGERNHTYDNYKKALGHSATSPSAAFAENAFYVMAFFAGLCVPLVGWLSSWTTCTTAWRSSLGLEGDHREHPMSRRFLKAVAKAIYHCVEIDRLNAIFAVSEQWPKKS